MRGDTAIINGAVAATPQRFCVEQRAHGLCSLLRLAGFGLGRLVRGPLADR